MKQTAIVLSLFLLSGCAKPVPEKVTTAQASAVYETMTHEVWQCSDSNRAVLSIRSARFWEPQKKSVQYGALQINMHMSHPPLSTTIYLNKENASELIKRIDSLSAVYSGWDVSKKSPPKVATFTYNELALWLVHCDDATCVNGLLGINLKGISVEADTTVLPLMRQALQSAIKDIDGIPPLPL